VVTQIAGISTAVIEAHEELAPFPAFATGLAGVFALLVLRKWRQWNASWAIIATLVVACVAAVLLAWTAYLGGRINHPKLQNDLTVTAFYN
jgi:protein-S-isoprenylcysteine O-methyltransferase Ste14